MKKIIAAIFCVLLMFCSLYGEAVDITSSAINSPAGENGHGSNPFVIDKNGSKIELIDTFDLSDSGQNKMILDSLKKVKYDYNKMHAENSDIKGWLWFDEYVYQPFTDIPGQFDKYFRKDIYGNFDWSGIPFMSDTSHNTLDGNSLIYGHNMQNGTAFGKLEHIDSKENFKVAKPLFVYDGNNDKFYAYKVFTVLDIEDGEEYINLKNFDNLEQRENYNKSLMSRSRYVLEDGWKIDWSRKAIFLQHCKEGHLYSDTRRVVGFYEFNEIDGSLVDITDYNGGK